eukprot:PhF_6_TR22468/c0_g1_i1/m.31860
MSQPAESPKSDISRATKTDRGYGHALPPLPPHYVSPPRDPLHWGNQPSTLERYLRDYIRSGGTLEEDPTMMPYSIHPEERYLLSQLATDYNKPYEVHRDEIDIETYNRTLRFPGVERYKYLDHINPNVEESPPREKEGPMYGPQNIDIMPPHLVRQKKDETKERSEGPMYPDAVGTWRIRPPAADHMFHSSGQQQVILYSAPNFVANALEEVCRPTQPSKSR